MNIKDIALRAQGYGIPGVIADGTDPLAMYLVASEAVARARRGEGPTLIEAKTHRKGGHAEGEEAFLAGQQYRTTEEKEKALAQRSALANSLPMWLKKAWRRRSSWKRWIRHRARDRGVGGVCPQQP